MLKKIVKKQFKRIKQQFKTSRLLKNYFGVFPHVEKISEQETEQEQEEYDEYKEEKQKRKTKKQLEAIF